MSALDEIVIAKIGEESLSLGEVLRRAKKTGQLAFLDHAIDDRVIARAIAARGLAATPEELERARSLFRGDHQLATDAELDAWLAARAMTREGLDGELATIVAFGKLKEGIASDRVEPYFEQHRRDFDVAFVSKGSELVRKRRRELAPELADAIFSASPGTLAGEWRVERIVPASLDHATRVEIHNQIFRAWLDEERRGVQIFL